MNIKAINTTLMESMTYPALSKTGGLGNKKLPVT
jgi:hypothetical protein